LRNKASALQTKRLNQNYILKLSRFRHFLPTKFPGNWNRIWCYI